MIAQSQNTLHITYILLKTSLMVCLCVLCDAAVQEERQRNREREGELEFSVGVNDEMPVEKILEAETAVEQKTELHSDGGSAGNSVSGWNVVVNAFTWQRYKQSDNSCLFCFSHMMLLATSVRLQTNSCLPWWSGRRESLISLNCPLMIRSSFCVQVWTSMH